jgi:hypothetical protein
MVLYTLLMNQKWETRGDICPISSFGVSYYVWLMIDKNVINNLLQYSLCLCAKKHT